MTKRVNQAYLRKAEKFFMQWKFKTQALIEIEKNKIRSDSTKIMVQVIEQISFRNTHQAFHGILGHSNMIKQDLILKNQTQGFEKLSNFMTSKNISFLSFALI